MAAGLLRQYLKNRYAVIRTRLPTVVRGAKSVHMFSHCFTTEVSEALTSETFPMQTLLLGHDNDRLRIVLHGWFLSDWFLRHVGLAKDLFLIFFRSR
jgi:hypothetical protein